MIKKMRSLFVSFAVLFLFSQTYSLSETLYQQVLKELKIQYVFSIPSAAYGPGTIFVYTKPSGYIGVCNPWEILGINELEYPTRLKEYYLPNLKKSINKGIDITLSEEEKLNIGVGYKNTKSIELIMTNGKLFVVDANLADMFENAKNGDNIRNILAAKKLYPRGKIFLAVNMIGYDIECKLKNDSGTEISGKIPLSVLKILMPKIGISWYKESEYSMAGRSIYIGFNGGKIDYKRALANTENREKEVTKGLEWDLKEKDYDMVDITEFFE